MTVPDMKLWRVQQGNAEWIVAAPDEEIALEVVLEHEADPSQKIMFETIDPGEPFTVAYGVANSDMALVVPTGASVSKDSLFTRVTAPASEWLRPFNLPGVLTCSKLEED